MPPEPRVLPPVEFWRGVRAEEGSELTPAREGVFKAWTVATIAEAVTGPTPGMIINRLYVLVRRPTPPAPCRSLRWPHPTASFVTTNEVRRARNQGDPNLNHSLLKT